MMPIMLSFEERLRVYLERTNRPYFAVAADVGISPTRLSRLLKRREMRPLKTEEIARLAEAVGVPLEELVEAEPGRTVAA